MSVHMCLKCQNCVHIDTGGVYQIVTQTSNVNFRGFSTAVIRCHARSIFCDNNRTCVRRVRRSAKTKEETFKYVAKYAFYFV